MSLAVPYRCASAALLLAAAVPVQGANTEPRDAAELLPVDSTFLALEPIDAPIVDGGRVDGVLHVTLVIQAKSEDEASALSNRMPELRAAALPATIEFARLHASRFAPVDVARLAATIAPPVKAVDRAIDKVLIVRVSASEQ